MAGRDGLISIKFSVLIIYRIGINAKPSVLYLFFFYHFTSIYHCRKYHHFKNHSPTAKLLFPLFAIVIIMNIFISKSLSSTVLLFPLEYMFRCGRAFKSKHMGIFYDLLYYQMVFQKDWYQFKILKQGFTTHSPHLTHGEIKSPLLLV